MSIEHVSEKEQQLTHALKRVTEALNIATRERDALKADALRWRYMRSKGSNWFGVQEKAHYIDFDCGLDEAVDAAMKGEKL